MHSYLFDRRRLAATIMNLSRVIGSRSRKGSVFATCDCISSNRSFCWSNNPASLHSLFLSFFFFVRKQFLVAITVSSSSISQLWSLYDMLKGFGKLTKKASTATLSAGTDEPPRSTTPTPGNPDGKPTSRTGLLTIRVLWAEDLALAPGVGIPPSVQAALSTQQARAAASVSPSSVVQKRLAKRHSARDSIQRTQCWWLPYLVMEFDVNQVLITALGGELKKPLYMYQAQL